MADEEQELQPARPQPTKPRVELPTFGEGSGLAPGVDLDNSAALLDVMEPDEFVARFPGFRTPRSLD
jgi:hypothetical protein